MPRHRDQLAVFSMLVLFASSSTEAGQAGALPTCELAGVPDDVIHELGDCKNNPESPACDRWWHLRQTGLLKARQILVEDKLVADACLAGSSIAVGQMDTGVVDPGSWKPLKEPGPGEPLDLTQMHPMLRATSFPNARIVTTSGGRLLPLSYNPGPQNTKACTPSELARFERTCAVRDPDAEAVPRDSFPDVFLASLLPVKQSGHGTGTMHVLLQAAPALTVVPYKFAGGIIVSESRTLRLARAVTSAALEDRIAGSRGGRIDIISMSLGRRSPSAELEQALTLAERQGIILVAAAGQWPVHPTNTRYPAAYSGVVAVTGTDVTLRPWNSPWRPWTPLKLRAARGNRNLLAAPATGVWRASWDKDQRKIYKVGSGTSFAAPLVAAAAAMWLQYQRGRPEFEAFGRAAVPSLFRYMLAHYGTRSPREVCSQLLTSGEWASICNQAATFEWDTEKWGRGILAADKLLTEPLPSKQALCTWVMEQRGAAAHASACGQEPAPVDPSTFATRPKIDKPSKATPVAGVDLLSGGFGGQLVKPAFSLGAVWSGNEVESPHGLLTRATVSQRTQEVTLGYAWLLEYSATGSRGKLDVFPMFGPTIGAAAVLSAVHERVEGEDQWWVGPKLQMTYYRYRVQLGALRAVGANRGWKGVWSLGVGF